MTLRNPSHPGVILRHDVLEPLGMSVTEAAAHLHMSRIALSRVLNGRAAISARLALRLERAGASTADFWLALQRQYDLAQARNEPQPNIHKLERSPTRQTGT